jgi:hypothetical protein
LPPTTFLDGVLIGQTTADIFLEELYELKLHPTGKCGFELFFTGNELTDI